ncbi:RagB/SusD family nutrient uptake outer membrane protein [Rhizosphaericola mali]|nr:RagB/SusD family nutrient uptake outer membrane protein [Rhizosphaericola mali]
MSYKKLLIILALVCLMIGCKKYLNEKSNSNLVVPQTLEDLQALLDRTIATNSSDPSATAVSSDEYYLTDNDWNALSSDYYKRMYKWDSAGLFQPGGANDWGNAYQLVYLANTVISEMGNIERTTTNANDWDNVIGQAYFYRGKAFYNIASIWCKSFDSVYTSTDLGIPLRTDPDFNIPSIRSTLENTYRQILSDLKVSSSYLPQVPIHVMRPSKGAAFGMLSRIYLFIRNYSMAEIYADSALKINSNLMDFNTIGTSKTYPIAQFNTETIYYSSISVPAPLNISRAKIDTNLYSSYANGDLRKSIFFRSNTDGSVGFRGNYTGGLSLFSGISVNELLLIHAECTVRLGDLENGLTDLNKLRSARWSKTIAYVPFTSVSKQQSLDTILVERKKELLMRGLWWQDVKRLNLEKRAISLHRRLNGQLLTLDPTSDRFVLRIPEDVIQLTGMQQNK